MSLNSHQVAVLLPIEPEYPNRLLEGAVAYAGEHPGLTLLEMPYTQSRPGVSPLPDGPLAFDAAMVWLNAADTWVERLLEEGVFVVNCSGDWQDKGLPMIAFNGPEIEKAALRHLAERKPGLVAYIGIGTSQSVLARRRKRFLGGATELGIDVDAFEIELPDEIVSVNRLVKLDKDAAGLLRRFLSGLPKPAAVWCDDDYVARLVCNHAAMEGIRIPEDLAVLGLGDYSVSRHGKPPISTIPQPGQLVGRGAIEAIHRTLDGEAPPGDVIQVPVPPVICRESTGGGGLADTRFQQIRREIRERACDGLTVPDLVEMLPMSQVTFSRHFARLFGRTPGEEIRYVRAGRAKHYLRTTSLSVERIAALCGFESQGNFSKFFRRHTGMSPSEYRQEESPGDSTERKS